MKLQPNTKIKCKGFDLSIGRENHQIALISHSNDEFTPFKAIKKGGKLERIKRMFKSKLSSSTHFFFEHCSDADVLEIIKIINN